MDRTPFEEPVAEAIESPPDDFKETLNNVAPQPGSSARFPHTMSNPRLTEWPFSGVRCSLFRLCAGAFEVSVDGTLVCPKLRLKRHAEPGEVQRPIAHHLGR